MILLTIFLGLSHVIHYQAGNFLEYFISERSQTWIIVPILFARCITEYYYSRKYHMDEVHSLEELLAAHPEARENLRKIVLGGDR